MKLYLFFALAMTCWFCLLELVELTQAGFLEYICNGWNLLDWANFLIFFWAFQLWARCLSLHETQLAREVAELDGLPFATCGSETCDTFGYFDPYKKMYTAREVCFHNTTVCMPRACRVRAVYKPCACHAQARFYTAVCVNIQLLKIVKFTNVILPKMSLMTRVLGVGSADLLFFGIVFGLTLFAFTMLMFIQIGSFMDDFSNQVRSSVCIACAWHVHGMWMACAWHVHSMCRDNFSLPGLLHRRPCARAVRRLFLRGDLRQQPRLPQPDPIPDLPLHCCLHSAQHVSLHPRRISGRGTWQRD